MTTSITTHDTDEMIVGPSERRWVDGRAYYIRRVKMLTAGKVETEHLVFSDSEITIESDVRIAEMEASLRAIFDKAYTDESARLRGYAVESLLETIGDIARSALRDTAADA